MTLSVAEMGSSNHWRIYFVTTLLRCSQFHVLDKSPTVRCQRVWKEYSDDRVAICFWGEYVKSRLFVACHEVKIKGDPYDLCYSFRS